MKKETLWTNVRNDLLIIASCLIIGINLNSFVNSASVYPGGFSGITLLIQRVVRYYSGMTIPFSVINYPMNFLLLAFSAKYLGKRFMVYTIFTIILTGMFADLLPTFTFTSDPLLASVFGGIINGVGVGLCLMANASGGGTDVIAILVFKRFNTDPWNYILIGNIVILVIAGVLFGWDQALYSIIFQFAATQMLQTLYRKYKRHTLFIVTNKAEQIYEAINGITNHGATILQATGAYKNEERSMVYSVISSQEVKKVLKAVRQVDPVAFINVVKTDQLDGRFDQA